MKDMHAPVCSDKLVNGNGEKVALWNSWKNSVEYAKNSRRMTPGTDEGRPVGVNAGRVAKAIG